MAQIYEVESVIENAKFIDNGVLLDKFQNYPIVRGLYDVKVIKTFIDKRGNTINVVKLIPHIHSKPECQCSCGKINHNWIQKEYIKNYSNTHCYKIQVCSYCNKTNPLMEDSHTFEISKDKPIKTCIKCGTIVELPIRAWEILTGQNTVLENRVSQIEWELLQRYKKGTDFWNTKINEYFIDYMEYELAKKVLDSSNYITIQNITGVLYHDTVLIDYLVTPNSDIYMIEKKIVYLGRDEDNRDLDDISIDTITLLDTTEGIPSNVKLLQKYMQSSKTELLKVIRKYNLQDKTNEYQRKWRLTFKRKYGKLLEDLQESARLVKPYEVGSTLWKLLGNYESYI